MLSDRRERRSYGPPAIRASAVILLVMGVAFGLSFLRSEGKQQQHSMLHPQRGDTRLIVEDDSLGASPPPALVEDSPPPALPPPLLPLLPPPPPTFPPPPPPAELEPVLEPPAEAPAESPEAAVTPADPAAELPAPVVEPLDSNFSVAFLLFTIDGTVSFPDVWAEFFESAEPSSFSVVVHRSDNSTLESPAAAALREACRGRFRLAPYADGTAWGQLIAPSQVLAEEALKDPTAGAFVYVSSTTLPVKSFQTVFDTLRLRANDSSVCFNPPYQWRRSSADPALVFPKAAQWMILSRAHAEKLVASDAVQEVDAACGGDWRSGCGPSTSEEFMLGPVQPLPASAMGSEWLLEHPSGEHPDPQLAEALEAEAAAGPAFAGGPVNDTLSVEGVNGGSVRIRDFGDLNHGSCFTWAWWEDYLRSRQEPMWGPQRLFARTIADATEAEDVESVLERHLDVRWSPRFHPQLFRENAMTSAFLLDGLCAHNETLFARKFDFGFTLRPHAYSLDACPADSAWLVPGAALPLNGSDCSGLYPAPIPLLDARDCRNLCCSMPHCSAWQHRPGGEDSCWLGSPARECHASADPAAPRWLGESLVEAPLPESAEAVRARVLQAFRTCYGYTE